MWTVSRRDVGLSRGGTVLTAVELEHGRVLVCLLLGSISDRVGNLGLAARDGSQDVVVSAQQEAG